MPRKRVSRGVRASAAASDNEDKEDDIADDPDLARLRKEVESYGKDLYIDDDDRRRLMKMNDLDRQQILAEREEKVDLGAFWTGQRRP